MAETVKTDTENLPAVSKQRRESIAVVDPIHALDTGKFEHIQRIATVMAASNLIPAGLREGEWEVEKVNAETGETFLQKVKGQLPMNRIIANCFLVVNQSVRWNMDPFAVAQCCSVVHGRLMYEGKLVHAVLEAKLGIRLTFKWNDKTGDDFGIVVSGTFSDGTTETVEGTVRQWKTTGSNSPWGKQPRLQLAYRGSREWARLHAPAVLLGVYTEDELTLLAENARALRSTTVSQREEAPQVLSLADRLAEGRKRTTGASPAETVDPETGEVTAGPLGEATPGGAEAGSTGATKEGRGEPQDGKKAPEGTQAASPASKPAGDAPAKAEAPSETNLLLQSVADELATAETSAEVEALRLDFQGALEHADADTREKAGALFDAKIAALAKAKKGAAAKKLL